MEVYANGRDFAVLFLDTSMTGVAAQKSRIVRYSKNWLNNFVSIVVTVCAQCFKPIGGRSSSMHVSLGNFAWGRANGTRGRECVWRSVNRAFSEGKTKFFDIYIWKRFWGGITLMLQGSLKSQAVSVGRQCEDENDIKNVEFWLAAGREGFHQ